LTPGRLHDRSPDRELLIERQQHSTLNQVRVAHRGETGERVPCVALLAFLDSAGITGRIALLKVDVEGHDVEALQGLADYLDPKRVACIYVESAETFDLVRSRGYIPFQTRKIYIDELLRFQKQHNGVRYFEPAQSGSENILWVARGSLHEQLLNHHVRAWQSLER
jgi:hypothetical protein